MRLDRLLELFKSIPKNDNLYLLTALSDSAGLFASAGRIIYFVQDTDSLHFECIDTEYLSLSTHIPIHAVENDASFQDGFYNLISYKGCFDNDIFVAFIKLCTVHAKDAASLNFKEFFYSLISLFQLPAEQSFKNALGLYGELKLMEYVYCQFGIDISALWHKSGSYSKTDFSLSKGAIEVKSVLSPELTVKIKHSQIFNDYPCVLVVANCEKCDSGETIEQLISTFATLPNAFNGINYAINLEKELKRISPADVTETKFSLIALSFFNSSIINPFFSVPFNVKELKYSLDLSDDEQLEQHELFELLN